MRRCLPLLLLSPTLAQAAPEGTAGSVFNMLFGLAAVLAVLFGLMHVLKRVQQHGGANAPLRVIGATSVGPRERVVLVEVAGKVLVLGVAAGHISALDSFDAASLPTRPAAAAPGTPGNDFAARLMAAMKGKRNAG